MSSVFLIKNVSKDIIDDTRFYAYEKASDYVKHMKKSLDIKKPSAHFDKSDLLTKTFQSSTPDNPKIHPSLMPKSSLSSRIKFKINLVNAYHQLSDLKPKPLKSKSKEEKNLKNLTPKRIFSPKKYNHSITKLLNCTHRPNGNQELFITNDYNLVKSNEKFYQRTDSLKRYKKLNKFFPLKEIIKNRQKSPKLCNLDSNNESNIVLYDSKINSQFYSSRDKTPKPQYRLTCYSPTQRHKTKGNK